MSQFFIKTGNFKYILNQRLIILLIFIPFFELFCQNSIDLIKNDTSVIIIDSLTNKIDSIKQKSDIETTVNYKSKDSIFFDLKNQKMTLYGNAIMDYGDIKLDANKIDMDWINQTIDANFVYDSTGKKIGKPIFTDKNESYETDKITYNFKSKKALISGIVTQQDEAYMQGVKVKKNEFDELFISDAKYTSCNLAEPHFHISAKKIKAIPKNKVVSGPFHLKFGNIPTPIGFIFGIFPQPKKTVSGIIVPSYGEEKRRGFYLRDGGYYFAVNDYLDLRVTGDIYSKGGFGASIGSNYKKRYAFSGSLNFDYNKSKTGEINNPIESNDFSLSWSHSPDSRGKSSRFSSSVNIRTNSYSQNKNLVYSDFDESISSQFNSNISYSKTFKGTPFNFSTNLRHSQNVQTKVVNLTLPSLNYNMNRIYPFKNLGKLGKTFLGKLNFSHRFSSQIQLSNSSSGSSFDNNIINNSSNSDQLDFDLENIDKILDRSKIGGRHSIPISTSFNLFKFFTFSPSVNYDEIWYLKKLSYSYDEVEKGVRVDTLNRFSRVWSYNTSLSASTRIYGTLFFKKGKIKAIRHVITPRIAMSFRPDFTKDRYGYYNEVQTNDQGDTKIYNNYQGFLFGGPSMGNSAALNFSIGNNLELKVVDENDSISGTRKIKIFDNLDFSSNYNFLADSFKLSKIRFSTRTSFFKNLISLSLNGSIDPYSFKLDSIKENSDGSKSFYQRRINQLSISNKEGIGSLDFINMSVGFRFTPNDFQNQNNNTNESEYGNEEEIDYINSNPEEYVDFKIPWSINGSYNLNRIKIGFRDPIITQTFNLSGDISLTEKTKATFRTGYDFKNKMLTQTSINVVRDLHCWRLSFSWVPFGRFQSFNLTLNAVSSLLQDLKLEKKSRFFDNL